MAAKSEQELRSQILSLVKEYYQVGHQPEEFVPGESPIRFGGRIFDEEELVGLVGASLDFWLTEGPYSVQLTKEFSEFMGMKYTVLANSGSSAWLRLFQPR